MKKRISHPISFENFVASLISPPNIYNQSISGHIVCVNLRGKDKMKRGQMFFPLHKSSLSLIYLSIYIYKNGHTDVCLLVCGGANGNPNPCNDLDEIGPAFPPIQGRFCPLPPGPGGPKTLKAEGNIFENCLQSKGCWAGCKFTRTASIKMSVCLLVCAGLMEIQTPALILMKFTHTHPHLSKEGFGQSLTPSPLPPGPGGA